MSTNHSHDGGNGSKKHPHLSVGDWEGVALYMLRARAHTLAERAAIILSLFPWFPNREVSGTAEWASEVQKDALHSRDQAGRLREGRAVPLDMTSIAPKAESFEARGERNARAHPGWPRHQIAGTKEWMEYVRSNASYGYSDYLPN